MLNTPQVPYSFQQKRSPGKGSFTSRRGEFLHAKLRLTQRNNWRSAHSRLTPFQQRFLSSCCILHRHSQAVCENFRDPPGYLITYQRRELEGQGHSRRIIMTLWGYCYPWMNQGLNTNHKLIFTVYNNFRWTCFRFLVNIIKYHQVSLSITHGYPTLSLPQFCNSISLMGLIVLDAINHR